MGGWAGEVEAIGYVTPRMYRVVWPVKALSLCGISIGTLRTSSTDMTTRMTTQRPTNRSLRRD